MTVLDGSVSYLRFIVYIRSLVFLLFVIGI